MVISVAVDLQKEYLILECVPQHARMYERYGFQKLAGHHCRAQDLDQLAVGMTLDLTETQLNRAVNLASGNLNMLEYTSRARDQKAFLCSCRTDYCWKDGLYPERGKAVCALRDVLLPHVERPA
jgi:hypothetical protein